MLRYTTDRARPGLVALYDIRLGNGAGQFLQPRSPHGASEYGLTSSSIHYIRYFGDKSFQSITCTGTDYLTRTTKRQNTQITQNNTTDTPLDSAGRCSSPSSRPLMSETHGQSDTRPKTTFPATHWLVPIILLGDRGTCG